MLILIDNEEIELPEDLVPQVIEKTKRYNELALILKDDEFQENSEANDLREWLDDISESILWEFVTEIYIIAERIDI